MAGLLATTLINLHDHRQARAWFQTGLRAAEQSEEPALRAWILVRQSVSALYWGDPRAALQLSTQAARLARHVPCVAAAWAPAVQARALARLGQTDGVRDALKQAETSFASLEVRPDEQDAYGYTAAQLHFYRSSALPLIGETAPAYEAQDLALSHYGPDVYLDTSLVRLDHSICLVQDGEPEEAVKKARHLLMSLPREHCSPIVLDQARRLYNVIPSDQRPLAAVQEYKEVLALGMPQ
jgi:tetratricopeptide (TPR) repeat protein